MPKQVQAWGCEWCNMTSRSKGAVVRHERHHCRKHKHCDICARFNWHETEGDDYPGGPPYIYTGMFCGEDTELEKRKSNCPDFEPKEAT
jgi:hypothetical protein